MPDGVVTGSPMTLVFTQDGTGGRTITLPVNAAGVLVLSGTAGAVDIANFTWDGNKWRLSSSSLANGSALSVILTSVNYTLTNTDDVVEVSTTGRTITFQSATTAAKKRYTIKNTSAGNISFATTGGQTVDGSTSGTIIPNQSFEAVPNANSTGWMIT
jgi:hypothetical protein